MIIKEKYQLHPLKWHQNSSPSGAELQTGKHLPKHFWAPLFFLVVFMQFPKNKTSRNPDNDLHHVVRWKPLPNRLPVYICTECNSSPHWSTSPANHKVSFVYMFVPALFGQIVLDDLNNSVSCLFQVASTFLPHMNG